MNKNYSCCYIGLGANLDTPKAQIETALLSLDLMEHSYLLAHSSLYQSQPMGPQDQPAYINAVAKLTTRLEPLELLDALQAIENNQGRIRKERWGARTLDLDLLIYGNTIIQSERLTIPHYGLAERDFVLQPLFEIAPALKLPDGRSIRNLLANCEQYGLQKL